MDTNNHASAVKPIHRLFEGPWHGDPKIVVGIDIGTTYSGVAFTYLVKGANQMLHRAQFPGQQKTDGKVPSLIWYNSNGEPELFAAEAETLEAGLEADDHGWELARHFKLHLHPQELIAKHNLSLEPLPFGVSLRKVYSDFLHYLLEHTQRSFEERIVDGDKIWQDHWSDMEVVIGHPNGYGIREQAFLRAAAVAAGFTTTEKAGEQIRFVTEAEASVHFCLHYTDLRGRLRQGDSFAVCDAGGSTVDTTLYTVQNISPTFQLGEERESACVQAGAIYVDKMVHLYLRHLFQSADLSDQEIEEYTIAGTGDFEARAKRIFHQSTKDYLVNVAGTSCTKPELGIRRGKLKLSGTTVQSFFDRYVGEIVASVELQLSSSIVPYILLVGGFGDSPHLREQLKARFGPAGTQVTTTDETASKAVADGALIWRCVNSVIRRAPHFSFGVEVSHPHEPNNEDHQCRPLSHQPSGVYVDGGWSQIVTKGIPIDSDAITRHSYQMERWGGNFNLKNVSLRLYGYSLDEPTEWLRNPSYELQDGFQAICVVTGNLDGVRNELRLQKNLRGKRYWVVKFDVCIIFGRTELEAFIEWEEEGKKKTGPATVIPISALDTQ